MAGGVILPSGEGLGVGEWAPIFEVPAGAMADEKRQAKQSVLTKVNTVLATAGLNDTVWSVRDCDSTLFVLLYKKIVGKASCALRRRRGQTVHNV